LQAEAHNVINTVASAAEGYPFVPPSWLPNILVPLMMWFVPGFVMASLFVYIVSGCLQRRCQLQWS
jgi:photosystem I subunit 8